MAEEADDGALFRYRWRTSQGIGKMANKDPFETIPIPFDR